VPTIAVLMACFNRRQKTLDCLERLRGQELPSGTTLQIFLFDDGSTDGTAETVQQQYPGVHLLHGTGSAYWSGGMRAAYSAAEPQAFDYYLWVNDDSRLEEHGVIGLLKTHYELRARGQERSIVVGSMCDPTTLKPTYGGLHRVRQRGRTWLRLVEPSQDPLPCDTFNGNCVLVPASVAQMLGNLNGTYTHGMSDYDYGLRAKALEIGCWVAPGFAGTCSRNSSAGTWRDGSLPFRKRWACLVGPKGLPPREWLYFCRHHMGALWPLVFVSPYMKCILSGVVNAHSCSAVGG
jgi:GT2 family glycosyltransferase